MNNFDCFSQNKNYVIGSGGVNTVPKTLSASENVQPSLPMIQEDVARKHVNELVHSRYRTETVEVHWVGVGEADVSASTWIPSHSV